MELGWMVWVGRVLVATTIATGAMAPSASAMAGPAAAAGKEDQEHQDEGNALRDQGDAHQAAGAHAEAARAYAKAFDAYAQRSKFDGKEKQAVSLAVDEFKLAQETDPQSLVLLEEEAAMLERFIERAKGKGALPEGIEEELARVDERIEALKQEQEDEKRETPPIEPEPEVQPEPEGEVEPEPDRRSRRKAAAILGSGVVGILGGAALIGVGGWTFGAADERRDARLPRSTPTSTRTRMAFESGWTSGTSAVEASRPGSWSAVPCSQASVSGSRHGGS